MSIVSEREPPDFEGKPRSCAQRWKTTKEKWCKSCRKKRRADSCVHRKEWLRKQCANCAPTTRSSRPKASKKSSSTSKNLEELDIWLAQAPMLQRYSYNGKKKSNAFVNYFTNLKTNSKTSCGASNVPIVRGTKKASRTWSVGAIADGYSRTHLAVTWSSSRGSLK